MNSNRFEIICYLMWCGAEATYGFDSKQKYDAARAFLDKLSGGGIDQTERGPIDGRPYYAVDEKDREAFQSFMSN